MNRHTLLRLLAVFMVLTMIFTLVASVYAAPAPSASPAPASQPDTPVAGIYRGASTAVKFDVSPALRDIAPLQPTDKGGYEIPELATGLEGALGPQDADGALQTSVGSGEIPSPIVSFDGPNNISGVAPPDPNGDVGPNHVVVMSNLSFQIFNKTGTSLYGPALNNTLWAGFGGDCQTDNSGDPVVLYDQLSDRWMLSQFTASGPTYFNCVAISTTPDPTGSYYRYAFSTGINFPDYPKYGFWSDALYISTREFANGSTFVGVGAYAINRAQLIAGNPAPTVISFLVAPGSTAYNIGDGLLPADLDGFTLPPAGSPEYYMGSMDNGGSYGAPQDALTLWKFVADFTTPANSSFTLANTIPISSYDTIPAFCSGRACIPQPGTGNKLDHLGYRQRPLHRLAYRNFGSHESLVTNQSVEASTTMSGIRWWEVRSPNSSPVLYQDSTYAPGLTDGIFRWMGSIAQDRDGNMALGYSVSDATSTYPGVRYTGRLSTDPLNTMLQGEGNIVTGTGSQTGGGNRWGDYTSMSVDPVDDCTFWYVNEWVPTTSASGWRLRIGAFKFDQCGADPNINVSPLSLSASQATNTTTTQPLTVANTGGGTLTWTIAEEPAVLPPMANRPGYAPGAAAVDAEAGTVGAAPAAPAKVSTWQRPEVVLYDNGPLVNSPGTGPGGADESLARDVTVGLTSRGFNHSLAGDFRVADDFTITDPGGWNISSITFFPYMGNAPITPSPITGINFQIWDGPPDQPTSSVVFGDTTTNRLSSTTFGNIYRRLESQPTDATRPVFASVATAGTILPAGTYWLDWQVDGDITYTGPWAPPVTIDGQTSTGNALQSTSGTWQAVVDASLQTPLGLPFIIEGTVVPDVACDNPADVGWLSVSPASGSNAGGTNTPVTVTFDSTGLAVGTYHANLCVTSNDPDPAPGNGTALVPVSVTLTVQPPTAVTLSSIDAGQSPSPAPAGLPMAALPAAAGAAMAAAVAVLRRRR